MMARKMGILLAAAFASATFFASAAEASITYSYVTDQASYSLVNGTATAKIYLDETLTSGSTSLITADGGLDGAAFALSVVGGSGVTISAVNFNPAFDAEPPFDQITLSADGATLNESTNFGSPGVGLDGSGLGVYLGSVTFAASGTGTVTFDLGRINSLGGNTITRQANDLDFNSSNPSYTGASGLTQFTVTSTAAVPEPGALYVLVAGSLMLLCSSRRLRRPQS